MKQETSEVCDEAEACAGCGGSTRRDFMRDLVGMGTAALATLAVGGSVSAATIGRVTARARRGTTVRYPIPAADGVQIDRDNQVILVRWENALYAFALSCPHQNAALRWRESDGKFQCPKHKSKYSADGTFLSGRATRGMDRFAITREGDAVVVDLAVLHEQPDDPAAWDASVVRLS